MIPVYTTNKVTKKVRKYVVLDDFRDTSVGNNGFRNPVFFRLTEVISPYYYSHTFFNDLLCSQTNHYIIFVVLRGTLFVVSLKWEELLKREGKRNVVHRSQH